MRTIKINHYEDEGFLVLGESLNKVFTSKNEVLSGTLPTTAAPTTAAPTTAAPTTAAPTTTAAPHYDSHKTSYCSGVILPTHNCIVSDRLKLRNGILE